jgi:hypothetical protein
VLHNKRLQPTPCRYFPLSQARYNLPRGTARLKRKAVSRPTMSLLAVTLLVQACALVAATVPKLIRSAPNAPIGFVVVVFASLYWFPKRWSGMEYISCGYLVALVVFEVVVYLLLWAIVILIHNARESASGG